MKNNRVIPYAAGIIGALLLLFIGWEYNIPAMAWVSYPLLVYSFRSIGKWYRTLPLAALMAIVRFVSIYGGWDMELWLVIAFSVVAGLQASSRHGSRPTWFCWFKMRVN